MRHDDYTVGWISALPREQAATLLDDVHEKLPVSKHDTTYILGRIDVHNVVVACLPTTGSTATARCVTRLEDGFKSLRFILLVGIGGGVPTIVDVRLGDVVVSMPNKQGRGIVQYDFRTRFQDEHLEIRESSLDRPSDLLVTAVSTLGAQNSQREKAASLGHRLVAATDELARVHLGMRSCRRPQRDRLYNTDYRHRVDGLTCDECKCDPSEITTSRPPRADYNEVYIHEGLIASGNEVMRDARERDQLAKEKGVLCFEMEAAGLKTDLGWLVIRGICDYCDSHKDKDWQDHAAAVASEYAKELLKVTPSLKDGVAVESSSGGQTSTRTLSNTGNVSGGQQNNFMGDFQTSGGQAFVGGQFRSDGPMHFQA
ncbi:MAG: hypothetical protein Q9162_007198 [Coniocarpon cinnabarinum]